MNENHNSHFSSGFLIGLIIGAGIVFLLGTRTGKNLLKILSDQGIEGLVNLLDEYDFSDLEEDGEKLAQQEEYEQLETNAKIDGHSGETTKRRFFKRFKK
jgi:hypothetical protein